MEAENIAGIMERAKCSEEQAKAAIEKVYRVACDSTLCGENPWIDALEAVAAVLGAGYGENADEDDMAHEIADGMVSVYTVARVEWAAQTAARGAAEPENGIEGLRSVSEIAAELWYEYARELVNATLEAIREAKE